MKDQLYLLRPGFYNEGGGPFYCGDSVSVEGFLSFFPQVRELVDVRYLDFPRPRVRLVDLLGEANQSMPVIILAPARVTKDKTLEPQEANGQRFLSREAAIRQYLSTQYGLPAAS